MQECDFIPTIVEMVSGLLFPNSGSDEYEDD
ncbi:hypothetical protein Bhyg_02918 [Pseudolycoriella hygida]|uniref:Uncharacterized protein n=1 Tax=Pseudolycoriella hygida TaxID=35572 RepID=A0A9Q0S913_9DIPT|nr:hypothetical protein Bhyg_02918 [Pseudolycoriella hygida]